MSKSVKSFLLLAPILSLLFVSCSSTKEIRQSYQYLKSDLYYDLTTPVYEGEITKTVLLKPVETSAMEPYTLVKRKGTTVVPLILYNYYKEKFEVTLGEMSLGDSYLHFITEALLAEINRSTCILLEEAEAAKGTEADYYLYIDIVENKTTARFGKSDSFFFIPVWDDVSLEWSNYFVEKATSNLLVNIKITDAERVVYEHTFPVLYETAYKDSSFDNLHSMTEACLDRMAEHLSEATKQLAEDISSRLSILVGFGNAF